MRNPMSLFMLARSLVLGMLLALGAPVLAQTDPLPSFRALYLSKWGFYPHTHMGNKPLMLLVPERRGSPNIKRVKNQLPDMRLVFAKRFYVAV